MEPEAGRSPASGVGLPPAAQAESVSPVSGETGIPNAARERSAFMAGWLTRHHRFDVQPEEAWLAFLDGKEMTDVG